MADHDDELRTLRQRAYSRDADIHLDSASLKRLRELENAKVEAEPLPVEEVVAPVSESVNEPDAEPEQPPAPSRWRLYAAGFGRWLTGLRRSTVLIALGIAVIAAILLTALTLVERVQSDPLLPGAKQVTRLSQDAGYRIPDFFGAGASGIEATGYESFHGLRTVLTDVPLTYTTGGNNRCLAVYSDEMVIAEDGSFTGQLFGGCAAGDFPAVVQFTVDAAELPSELVAAFPKATALQFVYDVEHDEVVVFADR